MDKVIIKDEVEIENLIYEVRGKKVMFDYEIAVTKSHDYFYDMLIIHCDIGKPISILINFADASAKLERS